VSPIFAAYKSLDDEFVVEDIGRISIIHDIFYFGRLFLGENGFVEPDVLLWMLGEEMPFCGQNFHC